MERGTKRNSSVIDFHVPFPFELIRDNTIEKFVEPVDDFNESILHLFWCDSKFINKSVYLVDE